MAVLGWLFRDSGKGSFAILENWITGDMSFFYILNARLRGVFSIAGYFESNVTPAAAKVPHTFFNHK